VLRQRDKWAAVVWPVAANLTFEPGMQWLGAARRLKLRPLVHGAAGDNAATGPPGA